MTKDGHVPDTTEFMGLAENFEAAQGAIMANVVNLLLSSEARLGDLRKEVALHYAAGTVSIYSCH